MVVAPGMPSVFWSSLSNGSAAETAEYLAGELGRVIDEIESETGAFVTGVLTDNASNMEAAWKKLERTRPLFGGGCAAHGLNLLIQDVCSMDFFKVVRTKAQEITTYTRDHRGVLHTFRERLAELNSVGRELVVPVETRWYSLHASLSRILENKHVLKRLYKNPRYTGFINRSITSPEAHAKLQKVKRTLDDTAFWNKLVQLINFLDPMIETLHELESDHCPTSRVYSRFKWLTNHPAYGLEGRRTNVQELIMSHITYRWNYVHTDVTGLAFLLDPHTNPDDFEGTDEKDTINEGCKFAERSGLLQRLEVTRRDLNSVLFSFSSSERSWTPEEPRNIDGAAPRDWWSTSKKQYPLPYELAKLVFAIPTSTAASERAWSIMDFIHSKKRNRLARDKVYMLAFVYVNHRATSQEKVDWARVYSYPESLEAVDIKQEPPRQAAESGERHTA